MVGQNSHAELSNGATDCPTFNKKNTSSKASMFQYMRTHKPQKSQRPLYQTSTSVFEEPREIKEVATTAPVTKEPILKRERRVKNKPVMPQNEVVAVSESIPENEKSTNSLKTVAKKEEPLNVEETTEAVPAVKEGKKTKNTVFKTKMKHLFKKRNKRTSRKNVVKCPQF